MYYKFSEFFIFKKKKRRKAAIKKLNSIKVKDGAQFEMKKVITYMALQPLKCKKLRCKVCYLRLKKSSRKCFRPLLQNIVVTKIQLCATETSKTRASLLLRRKCILHLPSNSFDDDDDDDG